MCAAVSLCPKSNYQLGEPCQGRVSKENLMFFFRVQK